MKHLVQLLIILFILSLGFVACNKDEEDIPEVIPGSEYFTIIDAEYLDGTIPVASIDANAPIIQAAYTTQPLIAGGTIPITIASASTVTDVFVNVQGESGYYKLPLNLTKVSNQVYNINIIISSDITVSEFTIKVALMGADDLVSAQATIIVSQNPTGTYIISGKWKCVDLWEDICQVDQQPISGYEILTFNENFTVVDAMELVVESANCTSTIDEETFNWSFENGNYYIDFGYDAYIGGPELVTISNDGSYFTMDGDSFYKE